MRERPVENRATEGESTGSMVGRIVGVFAVIGLCLGLGTVFGLWGFGVFDGQEGDLGAAIMGAFTLVGAYLFVVMVGVVIAALGGHYAARSTSGTADPVLAGSLGGAFGHFVLLMAFTLMIAGGFAVFGDDSTAADDSQSDTGASDDGIPEMDFLWKAGLALIPAAIVGGLTAKLFARRSGTPARPA